MSERIIREWQAVERIPFGRVIANDRESLLEFVEEPFQEAVGIMYDKNVPTVGSSCNIHDYTKGYAWITVDFDFMSNMNRQVVNEYEFTEKFEIYNSRIDKEVTVAGLLFPIQTHELPEEIGQKAVALAENFHEQSNFSYPNI
jgi:hypothetical protein